MKAPVAALLLPLTLGATLPSGLVEKRYAATVTCNANERQFDCVTAGDGSGFWFTYQCQNGVFPPEQVTQKACCTRNPLVPQDLPDSQRIVFGGNLFDLLEGRVGSRCRFPNINAGGAGYPLPPSPTPTPTPSS